MSEQLTKEKAIHRLTTWLRLYRHEFPGMQEALSMVIEALRNDRPCPKCAENEKLWEIRSEEFWKRERELEQECAEWENEYTEIQKEVNKLEKLGGSWLDEISDLKDRCAAWEAAWAFTTVDLRNATGMINTVNKIMRRYDPRRKPEPPKFKDDGEWRL